LHNDPANAVAQAYYGYIIMVHERDVERGVHFMRRGLRASKLTNTPVDEQIRDARIYLHLGEGLGQLGRSNEAYKVYEEAVRIGLFPSTLQRSLHNLAGLKAQPWLPLDKMECARQLRQIERHWIVFREEASQLLVKHPIMFETDERHCEAGVILKFWIRRDGLFINENCAHLPTMCEILKDFVEESKCVKDEIKLSLIHAGTAVRAHCGVINYVLEAELGLAVSSNARIRVGHETKGWKLGKFLVRDTSFETEISFDGAAAGAIRMVLSIELWHPQVPHSVRSSFIPNNADEEPDII